ncbi:pyridoxal phosphate-dependent aminotransferase, partial [Streptomyces antibioticus]
MPSTEPEGHGPVRYGPPFPVDGLPVPPGLAAVLAGAAGRADGEPVGGGPALLTAAAGYVERRAPCLLYTSGAADDGGPR